MTQSERSLHNLPGAQERIRNDVEKFGWHVMLVLAEGSSPGWGYSIGLHETFKHPEVVLFGLSKDLTHSTINFIGNEIKTGKRFEPGEQYPDILEGVYCSFQSVEKIWFAPFLGQAATYYRTSAFPCLQCIWPDKNQHYPWDVNFRRDWVWAQPLLYHADPIGLMPLRFCNRAV